MNPRSKPINWQAVAAIVATLALLQTCRPQAPTVQVIQQIGPALEKTADPVSGGPPSRSR